MKKYTLVLAMASLLVLAACQKKMVTPAPSDTGNDTTSQSEDSSNIALNPADLQDATITSKTPAPSKTTAPKTTSKSTATPTPSPTSKPSPAPTPAGTPPPNPSLAAKAVVKTVTITSKGFSPSSLKIKAGDSVTFLNKDTKPHWPASDPHPLHTICPGFDALKGLKLNEKYTFTFKTAKTCSYHDHLNTSWRGTITVQ